jgi:hypothetical protein
MGARVVGITATSVVLDRFLLSATGLHYLSHWPDNYMKTSALEDSDYLTDV